MQYVMITGPTVMIPGPRYAAPNRIVMLNNKLPLWYQIAQSLRSEIVGMRGKSSLRLPTEEQIAKRYGVSIITVRQALRTLEEEGLISRKRRFGTFVNPDALSHRPLRLLGALETVF